MPSPEELVQKYTTPRAAYIDRLERYVDGTQYEGRMPFLSGGDVPLLERAPCVVYPIVKRAIDSNVSFVLGEGRFPQFTTGTSEDDAKIDPVWGLEEEVSDALERFVNVVVVKQAQLKKVFREALRSAQATGTVVAVVCARKGKIYVDIIRSKWCEPTYSDTGELQSIEIRYPYLELFYNEKTSKYEKRCLIYRRVINAVDDTVYKPGEAKEDGSEPSWSIDKAKSTRHDLGFIPAHWYQFSAACEPVNSVDGHAIHEHLLDELDAINFSLSQRHRAALYAGDPQMAEFGVAEDHNPSPAGPATRAAVVPAKGPDGKTVGVFRAQPIAKGNARRKGAGIVWRYPDPASKVELLTLPGDALKSISDHAADLRAKIAESLATVFLDPHEIKAQAALSGKALAYIYASQIAKCDEIRDDFGEGFMLPVISLMLRLILVLERQHSGGLYMPGIKQVLPILSRFERVTQDGTMWLPPRIDLTWGTYFESSAQDDQFLVTMAKTALDAGLVTRPVALEKLRSVFTFGSTEELIEAVDMEREERSEASKQEPEEKKEQEDAPMSEVSEDSPPSSRAARG